ncbi:hypothetical protein AURDEDRAFT_77313 [Auricularia subglabra TFB-10046 SS5]|uniref:Uncharacterized protein n=1 Tax=Auricularia subglabra (strain TFB-10046 / SS5) TaxID=717982 RepID=J0WL14_AURST|nr:hypothetical protein AURDEDRAFT_77313 [Auricularia subglabra TFB-10046 SS5]
MPIDPVLWTPITPTRRPLRDIDPALVTPTRQGNALRAALAGTAASFLVAPAKVTAAQVLSTLQPPVLQSPPLLEQPVWALTEGPATSSMSRTELEHHAEALSQSLALSRKHLLSRDKINASYAAQLVLQNVYLGRITEALYGKENKEPVARSFFPKGHGRVLTDAQFVALLEAESAEKEAEEADKARRVSKREQRKAQKLANEQLWQEWCKQHEHDLEVWKREYKQAREDGVLVKNIRKRPARPKRSDLPPLPAIDSDEDTAEEEEENQD